MPVATKKRPWYAYGPGYEYPANPMGAAIPNLYKQSQGYADQGLAAQRPWNLASAIRAMPPQTIPPTSSDAGISAPRAPVYNNPERLWANTPYDQQWAGATGELADWKAFNQNLTGLVQQNRGVDPTMPSPADVDARVAERGARGTRSWEQLQADARNPPSYPAGPQADWQAKADERAQVAAQNQRASDIIRRAPLDPERASMEGNIGDDPTYAWNVWKNYNARQRDWAMNGQETGPIVGWQGPSGRQMPISRFQPAPPATAGPTEPGVPPVPAVRAPWDTTGNLQRAMADPYIAQKMGIDTGRLSEHLEYGKIPYAPLADRQRMVQANAMNRADARRARMRTLPWDAVRTPAEAAYEINPTETAFQAAYPWQGAQIAVAREQAKGMGARMEQVDARTEAQLRTRFAGLGWTPDQIEAGVTAWKQSQGMATPSWRAPGDNVVPWKPSPPAPETQVSPQPAQSQSPIDTAPTPQTFDPKTAYAARMSLGNYLDAIAKAYGSNLTPQQQIALSQFITQAFSPVERKKWDDERNKGGFRLGGPNYNERYSRHNKMLGLPPAPPPKPYTNKYSPGFAPTRPGW